MNGNISVPDWISDEWVESAALILDLEASLLAKRGEYDAATDKVNLAAYLRWSWERLQG
jgi:hypothetical protein